jgi:hypothetical protein
VRHQLYDAPDLLVIKPLGRLRHRIRLDPQHLLHICEMILGHLPPLIYDGHYIWQVGDR